MGPFKYYIVNTLNMSLPFPLFSTYNSEGISPDKKIKFCFNVDSNYPTNIVQFKQRLNSVANPISIVALNSTMMPAYSIAVGVSARKWSKIIIQLQKTCT